MKHSYKFFSIFLVLFYIFENSALSQNTNKDFIVWLDSYKKMALKKGISKNTIEIVLENSTSPYYYYFYDSIINSHIFSKNYEDHKHRLNEYRKKEK